jgi:16S rRNA G527 N7-methylase RsmG
MEVEIFDSNEKNQGFITNVQERIIVQETVLARGRAEHTTKSKLLVLPIDPTTGRNFTCHNFHWQGSTHTDTSIGEVYLQAYKSVIPIKADEIKEGGGFDEDEKFILPLIREVDITRVILFLFLARMVTN